MTSAFDPSRRRWLQAGGLGLAAGVLACAGTTATVPSAAAAAAAIPSVGPLRLNLNESSYGPSPKVGVAVQRAFGELPRYVTQDQADALQRQIAAYEGVAPEQVVLGEVLEALGQHLALAGGPGNFVYSVPGYGALVDAAAPFGGRAVEVPLAADLGNDLPALAAAATDGTRAVYLVNPHNPTGTLSDGTAFDAFVQALSARTLVIVDEAYLDYREDFERLTAVRLLRAGANVVVFRTFGKLHALAGLQIGYALAPRPLADALHARGVGGAHTLNQLSIAAASASLADPDYHAGVRRQVAAERAIWHAWLDTHGLRHSAATASFVFFDSGRPALAVMQSLAARGVVVGRPFPPLDRWLRITLGRPEENQRARQALAAALSSVA